MATLARQGYNLIIAVGYTEIGAVKAVAKQYPKTEFAVVDVCECRRGWPEERGRAALQGAGGRLPGRLCGRRRGEGPRRHVVSSVGGEKQPPVDRYIAGYQAGAKAAFPGVKTINGYSQDFDAQAKCKEVALNQIARGSVVVFQVAGGCGLGVLDAAKEKGVWGVGVDADQGYLGTLRTHLGAEAGRHRGLRLISDSKNGRFKGGSDAVYGLKVGGVGIGRFSPKAPVGIRAQVEAVRKADRGGHDKDIPTIVK